ncbi:hypothetical protein D3C72_1860340 [compost metagenome]
MTFVGGELLEGGGRVLLGRQHLYALLRHLAGEGLVGQRLLPRLVHGLHHRVRRGLGGIQAVPGRDLEAGNGFLRHRGHAGELVHPAGRSQAQRPDLAALGLGQGRVGLVEHGVHLIAHQIVQRGAGALVGDGGDVHAGLAGEHGSHQVRGRAHAGIAEVQLAGVLLAEGDQVGHRFVGG